MSTATTLASGRLPRSFANVGVKMESAKWSPSRVTAIQPPRQASAPATSIH